MVTLLTWPHDATNFLNVDITGMRAYNFADYILKAEVTINVLFNLIIICIWLSVWLTLAYVPTLARCCEFVLKQLQVP